ncbi:MAG: hypothetical protein HY402_03595 [Elusimicrobia bacterium]|nr:hypothetical protein [Elusimicrobiota bacterium]
MAVLVFAALGAALLAGCGRFFPSSDLSISGTIALQEELSRRAGRPNTVLFVVATDRGGIPIAVVRIVNPRFPLSYRMGPPDRVLPSLPWKGPFYVSARIDRDGSAGPLAAGDLFGVYQGAVSPGGRGVDILIDTAN